MFVRTPTAISVQSYLIRPNIIDAFHNVDFALHIDM